MTSPQPVGHEVIGMEVPGRRLAIETFTSVNEPVLTIHGVSSQRRLWNWLLGGHLGLSWSRPPARPRRQRGRQRSFLDEQHAADMIAVLDHLGVLRRPDRAAARLPRSRPSGRWRASTTPRR